MYPNYLPTVLLEEFASQDREWLMQARVQRGFFRKLHAVALVSNNYEQEALCKSILTELNKEVVRLERNCAEKSGRNIRFVDGTSATREGRTRDANEIITNVKPKDTGLLPEKAVRYRWTDQPGKDNVGDADSNGSGKAG